MEEVGGQRPERETTMMGDSALVYTIAHLCVNTRPIGWNQVSKVWTQSRTISFTAMDKDTNNPVMLSITYFRSSVPPV